MNGKGTGFHPGWTATILTGIVFSILVSLGGWQWQRMAWKTGILNDIKSAVAGPALPVETAPKEPFVKVEITIADLRGPVLAYGSGAKDGRLMSDVLRAVDDGDGRFWVVNLGAVLLDEWPGPAPKTGSTVVGILRPPQKPGLFTPANDPTTGQFYSHDLTMMGEIWGVTPEPWIIDTGFVAAPVDIPNNHFTYALTWFGIAAALIAVYLAYGFRPPEDQS